MMPAVLSIRAEVKVAEVLKTIKQMNRRIKFKTIKVSTLAVGFLMGSIEMASALTKVTEPTVWTFNSQTAGTSYTSLTEMQGLYLRGSGSRPLEIQAADLSGTFSDGIAWTATRIAYSKGSAIASNMTATMQADAAVSSKKTDGCMAFTTTQAGKVYVIMKSHSNGNKSDLSLYFNGECVDQVAGADNSKTCELSYNATEAGTFFIGSNAYYSVAVVRFVPNITAYSVTAPADCFAFTSPVSLDLRNSDLEAYVASSVGDAEVVMKRIRKVPAMTGVVMLGTEGQTYDIPVLKGTVPDIGRNLLVAATQTTAVNAEEPGTSSAAYHHNSDEFAAELVRRWQDYWQERPGQGTAVNAGGAKIHFSDSQTHTRGVENFRTSGVVDPMRLPKDAFYVHQAMWDGWVDDLKPHTYICGHWNYEDGETVPRIYVVSTSPTIVLQLPNGTTLQPTKKEGDFLYWFENVPFMAGTLTALGEGTSYSIETVGDASSLVLTAHEHPTGWKADGADLALVDVEIVDASGRRCPLDNREVTFTIDGPAEWLGGVAHGSTRELGERWTNDNYVRSAVLPVECGINRVMLRSWPEAGEVTLTAQAEGLAPVSIRLTTNAIQTTDGLSTYLPSEGLPSRLNRGATPSNPSFIQHLVAAEVQSVTAGSGTGAELTIDGKESTTWESGNALENAYIKFTLSSPTQIRQISMKTGSARYTSYPIAVYAGDTEVYRGYTGKTLGYCRFKLADNCPAATEYTIRMMGESTTGDAFGDVSELDGSTDVQPSSSYILRISEIELLKNAE